MKTIYLDSDYRCHVENNGGMRAVETSFFDGRCKTYIEGFRYVPNGEHWIRADGVAFYGEMIAAAVDYSMLEKAQSQYETDESSRLSELGIPQEYGYTATRNYSIGSFIGIHGQIYEVICAIPEHSSISNRQNVIETTVEHYLDTLKEKK